MRFTGGGLLLTGDNLEPWIRGTASADAILVMDLSTSTARSSMRLISSKRRFCSSSGPSPVGPS
ncbi:MAG: hypothetical protein ACE15B_20255 [Bryobacteraceae bacterium]